MPQNVSKKISEIRCSQKDTRKPREEVRLHCQTSLLSLVDEYYLTMLGHGYHLDFAGSFFHDCLLNAFSYFVLEAVGSFPLLPTVSHFFTTMHHHHDLPTPLHTHKGNYPVGATTGTLFIWLNETLAK